MRKTHCKCGDNDGTSRSDWWITRDNPERLKMGIVSIIHTTCRSITHVNYYDYIEVIAEPQK